ncbi:hypothetical protein AB1Y20_023413 [Prymnesium parvum]|uniref:Trichome birefringence-like C-terminal domain-containing protein n=1 Tax=Prymnesium parvum TaxID=97485 RepID=A0AB34JGB8_PRYPA
MPRRPCFSHCPSCTDYTSGEWVERHIPPPYHLNHSVWARMGLRIEEGSAHDYGQCASSSSASPSPPHSSSTSTSTPVFSSSPPASSPSWYEWEPSDCELPPVDRPATCRLLRGKQILFVGDSQMAQLFTSAVMLLAGAAGLGVDYRAGTRASVLSDVTASACNDTVRLNFVRSDLLAWSNSGHEAVAARKCNRKLKLNPFVVRASAHADLLVLGTGLHVPASTPAASATHPYFSLSLHHTLAAATAARRHRGLSAASVALVAATLPLPGCARFAAPLATAAALRAEGDASLSEWSADWAELHRINEAARWLAAAARVGFLDVSPLSALRPDATMARHARRRGAADDDCVHFCQPGPVDTWVRLLFSYWAFTPAALAPAARRPRREAGAFFRLPRDEWLSARGSAQARALEDCVGRSKPCFTCLADQQWWPFGNCSGVSEAFVRDNCAKRHTVRGLARQEAALLSQRRDLSVPSGSHRDLRL